jgi:hypothetical protein
MKTAINQIYFLFIAILLFLSGCSKNDSPELSTITSLSTNLKNNIEKNTSIDPYLADNAALFNVTTLEHVEGKENVAKYFTDTLGALKEREMVISSKGVRVISLDQAIERGSVKLFQKGEISQRFAWKAEYTKADGVWKLYKITLLSLHKPFSNFAKLEGLGWLVGKWKYDDGDIMSIASHIKWDRNKNFLIQHFRLTVLDHHELSGVQIIGWDPIYKRIFSWTYDSKGGFGTGRWVQKDDTWYAYVEYTMNDGRKATVTHVYKKINDTTYQFSSENREIGGIIAPNCGPFNFVRRG